MRVAVATSQEHPDLPPDERLLLAALTRAGLEPQPVVWRDADERWSRYDAVLVRSTWDYHRHPRAFLAWLDQLEARRVPTFNSRALLRWNLDKRYLLSLAEAGVSSVPTHLVARGTARDVEDLRMTLGAIDLVVKPSIDASGERAWRTEGLSDRAVQQRVDSMAADHDLLVQPLVHAIFEHGETSLVFIDGCFSHGVLKRAARGEFRIQTEHGGSVATTSVAESVTEWGLEVLAAVATITGAEPLFARVDWVPAAGGPMLMEVETIEPELYFARGPGSADQLALALAARLHLSA